MAYGAGRVFLFLQGPHGPFFRRLAGALTATGAEVRRVAFNRGDLAEWRGAGPVDAFTGKIDDFPLWLEGLVWRHRVTDLVLYGDARPPHQAALALARRQGLLSHCFEEGYLRPHWITYERQGTNGNSLLCSLPLSWMAAAGGAEAVLAPLPARWGDVRQHLWWSAAYHLRQLLPSRRFSGYPGHRELPLWREAGHYATRLAGIPIRRLINTLARRRLRRQAPPFHLVLLQLSFDCSMRSHSRYPSNAAFVREVLEGFAAGAPRRDHLVFKSHPFEDGRERLARVIAREAARLGVAGRVHFLDGDGGLDALLDRTRSVLTVNSTAGQQALARGLPLFAAGAAVYARSGLVSSGDLGAFFADLPRPDERAYRLLRAFMLRTSQIEGSFYSKRGIDRALQTLPSMLMDPTDPYRRVLAAAPTTLQPEKRSA